MCKDIKVLGVVGSIRSNYKNIDKLMEAILASATQQELNKNISSIDKVYSNSDISIAHALLGAKQYGATIELVCITDIFEHKKLDIYYDLMNCESLNDIAEIDSLSVNENKFRQLLEKLEESSGVVLATPVYFGDRSSIANKFLQLTQKYKSLKNKAFGAVSVGAKRNGGQETANIYTLQEAIAQEAIVVGNGPKTAQYGGTVWAGDMGIAISDDFGLETCFGVGRQVAQLSEIVSRGQNGAPDEKIKITFLLTMDTSEKKYEQELLKYTANIDEQKADVEVYNLIDNTIYRCIACNVCPSPRVMDKFKDEEFPYHCVIQAKKDDMRQVQKKLVASDCIVFVGVNTTDDLIYRYQAFMERTRFIRHDDFELTNIPAIGMLINELGATNNQIHNVKVLTSFIRHNTFFLKPIDLIIHRHDVIYQDDINKLLPILATIKKGRNAIDATEVSYKSTGYSDKTLDSTKKLRK